MAREKVRQLLDLLKQNNRPEEARVRAWLSTQDLTREERLWAEAEVDVCYQQIINPKTDLEKLLASLDLGGFIGTYLSYCKDHPSPMSYHLAMATTMVSASFKRRIWVDTGLAKLYPAMQFMLIGPAGVGKTIATRYALDLIQEFKFNDPLFPIVQMSQGSSVGLFASFATGKMKEGQGLMIVPEMGSLFSGQDYNKDLTGFLCDLFDSGPFVKRLTRTHDEEIINAPAVSAVMCTNPKFLGKAMSEDVLGTGLFRRILVFCEDEIREGKEGLFARDENLVTDMIYKMASASGGYGQADLTPLAEQAWIDIRAFYQKEPPIDHRLDEVWKDIPIQTLKLAMVLALSESLPIPPETPWAPVIQDHHVTKARALVDYSVETMPSVMDMIGENFWARTRQEILAFIKHRGGTAWEIDVVNTFGKKLRPMYVREHLQAMKEAGTLSRVQLTALDNHKEWAWRIVGR